MRSLPILAGPEIGVASTKAFTCQLSALACLAIALGKARGQIDEALEQELVGALTEMPRHISSVVRTEADYLPLATELSKARDILYLGRGMSFPIAMEGALKLKEISYIHAEGYAAGELKHGPIALIDEKVSGDRDCTERCAVRENDFEYARSRGTGGDESFWSPTHHLKRLAQKLCTKLSCRLCIHLSARLCRLSRSS